MTITTTQTSVAVLSAVGLALPLILLFLAWQLRRANSGLRFVLSAMTEMWRHQLLLERRLRATGIALDSVGQQLADDECGAAEKACTAAERKRRLDEILG